MTFSRATFLPRDELFVHGGIHKLNEEIRWRIRRDSLRNKARLKFYLDEIFMRIFAASTKNLFSQLTRNLPELSDSDFDEICCDLDQNK